MDPTTSRLTLQEVRLPATRSEELDQAWRKEKYTGVEGHLEGVVPVDLVVEEAGGSTSVLPVIAKIRGGGGLATGALPLWLDRAGVHLSRPLIAYATVSEFTAAASREITLYRLSRRYGGIGDLAPRFIGASRAGEDHVLVIERVTDAVLMDRADSLAGWSEQRVASLVGALAELHAVGLGHPEVLKDQAWPASPVAAESVLGDRELFCALCRSGRRYLPDIVTTDVEGQWTALIDTLEEWYPPKDQLLRTLVHNDFNPRNVCFRGDGTPLAYDWELALLDIPQRDLIELLTFTLTPEADPALLWSLSELHRRRLAAALGRPIDRAAWEEGVRIQLRYQAVNRVAWQWLFATRMALPYVARITATIAGLVRLAEARRR